MLTVSHLYISAWPASCYHRILLFCFSWATPRNGLQRVQRLHECHVGSARGIRFQLARLVCDVISDASHIK